MDPAERERLRIALLQQLELAGDAGRALPSFVTLLKLADFADINDEIVRGELVYLMDKGLVATMEKLISPEMKRWRITAAGRDFLAQSGF